jgi:hypothetical protein
VLEHLDARNLTVLECKHSLQAFRPSWNTYFWVRARDETGRTMSGLATATGLLRRKAWVEWSGPANARSASALDALRRHLRALQHGDTDAT